MKTCLQSWLVLAEEFFAELETPEEARERRAWQKLSTEVLARESD